MKGCQRKAGAAAQRPVTVRMAMVHMGNDGEETYEMAFVDADGKSGQLRVVSDEEEAEADDDD